MRLRIAFRNTLRNRRRTALNIVMIAGGVAAIILFRGFSQRILKDFGEAVIRGNTGHFQLATRAYWEKTEKTPRDGLLDDFPALAASLRNEPHVTYVAGRITFYGLISAGEKAMSARGLSLDPHGEERKNASLKILEGERLDATKPYRVIIGTGLAKRMGVQVGNSITILSYTFDSVVNAIDVEIGGIFGTGVLEFDDTTVILTLDATQKLLDTDKVEQVIVGIDATENVPLVMPGLQRRASQLSSQIEVKPWTDFAGFYHQAVSFLGTQNRVIEFILLTLVLLGVLNTIGMSVFERSGEIGTVRALGDTEEKVLGQFVLEGAILGGIGAVAGCFVGTAVALLVNAVQIPIVVPGASAALKIRIDLLASSYREAIVLAIIAATVAAVVPAVRASRMNIVDALRRA